MDHSSQMDAELLLFFLKWMFLVSGCVFAYAFKKLYDFDQEDRREQEAKAAAQK